MKSELIVMKKVKLFLLVLPVAMLTHISCSKDGNSPDHPVEVQFQLLNEAGEPTTSFREGEDITFDYKIVNKGSKEVVWMYHTSDYTNLFEVSRIAPSQSAKVIGTPYQNMNIVVTGLMKGTKLEPNAENIIRMTWLGDWDRAIFFSHALNGMYELHGEESLKHSFFEYLYQPSLSKGTYRVTLDQALTFKNESDLNVRKIISFEVL